MTAEPRIPDAAVDAYGRAYDATFMRNKGYTGAELARVETEAIRAGLAAAAPWIAAQALRDHAAQCDRRADDCRDKIGLVDGALLAGAVWKGAAKVARARADELPRGQGGRPGQVDPTALAIPDLTDRERAGETVTEHEIWWRDKARQVSCSVYEEWPDDDLAAEIERMTNLGHQIDRHLSRTVTTWPDGLTLTGPWQAVDDA